MCACVALDMMWQVMTEEFLQPQMLINYWSLGVGKKVHGTGVQGRRTGCAVARTHYLGSLLLWVEQLIAAMSSKGSVHPELNSQNSGPAD